MSSPDIVQQTDSVAIARGHLLSQYTQAVRLLGLISAGCHQADSVEQAMFEIRDGFWIATAVGAQLDVLGNVYGLSRDGMDDDTYRTELQYLAASWVNGSPEEIMAFLRFITGARDIAYLTDYPAGYALTTNDAAVTVPLLQSISPAGVQASLAVPMTDYYGRAMVTALGEPLYSLRS